MRRITDSYIETYLKNDAKQLSTGSAEEIWQEPVGKASGDEWYLDGLKNSRPDKEKIVLFLAVIGACLAIWYFSA